MTTDHANMDNKTIMENKDLHKEKDHDKNLPEDFLLQESDKILQYHVIL